MTAKKKVTPRKCLKRLEAIFPIFAYGEAWKRDRAREDLLGFLGGIIHEHPDVDVYGVLDKLVNKWLGNDNFRAYVQTHDYMESLVGEAAYRGGFTLAWDMLEAAKKTAGKAGQDNEEKKQ